MARSGAIPVPPAMNTKRRSRGCSGSTNDPYGPSTPIEDPRASGPKCPPQRALLSTLIRNSSWPLSEASFGAPEIEYGTRTSVPPGPMRTDCPALYLKSAPRRSTRTIRADGVARLTLTIRPVTSTVGSYSAARGSAPGLGGRRCPADGVQRDSGIHCVLPAAYCLLQMTPAAARWMSLSEMWGHSEAAMTSLRIAGSRELRRLRAALSRY